MSASLSVGFIPVTPGSGVVVSNLATNSAAAAVPEAEGEMGFLDALMGMLTEALPATPEGDAAAAALQSFENLADLGVSAEIGVDPVAPAMPTELPPATSLPTEVVDLVKALAALDQAVADGKPVNPALKKKLIEALDALGGMLGIQMPVPPAIDPAITAAAQVDGVANPELDPLLEITKAASPVPAVPAEPSLADTIPTETPEVALTDAERLATAPAAEPKPGAFALPKDVQLTALIAASPDAVTPLDKMVKKLAELAQKLGDQAPELTQKLELIAQKLANGDISAEAFAKLHAATELNAADIEALLAPKTESKPASAPQFFAAPTLAVPEVALAPKQVEKPAPLIAAPAAPTEAPATEPSTKITLDAEPVETRNASEQAPARGTFAQAMTEAKADQVQQPQVQPAQVKTELGIVAPKTVHAAYQAPVQQVNMPQVAFELVRQVQQGNSRFQIRLDPPELGRIDVKMQIDKDGNVSAKMTVERSETLDLMQRDQRSLEKALAQAGLDSSKTNLEFSLRQNPFAREETGNGRGGNGSPFSGGRGDEGDETPEVIASNPYRGSASASGVNLFV